MDVHALSGRPSPEQRERLVRNFEAWLEKALADEAPPSGLTAELLSALETGDPLPPVDRSCDLYSLWCAMTALTQEVRLQGRAFTQLKDTLFRGLEASRRNAAQQASAKAGDRHST